MYGNERVRQAHRVVALGFVATAVVTVAAVAVQGPDWMFYLPLPALALLLLSGLYLYVAPHLGSRRRATASTGSRGPQVRPAGTRALHRWAAAVFVLSIVVVSVTLALQGPMWVSYLPLLPLAVLLFTGLAMLVRQKASRRNDTAEAGARGRQSAITHS